MSGPPITAVKRLIKQMLPRSLLGRSLLILVVPLVVLQVVSFYVFYENHWGNISRRLAAGVAGDIGLVVDLLHDAPDAWPSLRETALRKMDLEIRLEPEAILPNIRPRPLVGQMEEALAGALEERVGLPYLVTQDEREVLIRLQLPDAVMHVQVSRKRLYSSTTYIFVLWMLGTSLLLFGVATIFMRNQVRSIRKLAAAADSFGKGREVPDFKAEGAAEVRQAAAAFNLMRERLKRQIQQRTEMLAGVSHDLRTPLTRMKLQLAMMGQVDGIDELKEDVSEMEHMVEGYLAFARGEGSEQPVPTELAALLDEVVGRFRREGKAVDLHCEGQDLTLPLRRHAMGRCLSNLLANGCRHASHVAVRAGLREDGIEITVDDDGPGVPADKREEVFKAFVRLDPSRNLKTGGVGLGLTIARDVVRAHGGDIHLEDSPLGGLRARIRLPL